MTLIPASLLTFAKWREAPVGAFLLASKPNNVPVLRGDLAGHAFAINLGEQNLFAGIDLTKALSNAGRLSGLIVEGAEIAIDPKSLIEATFGDEMIGCISLRPGFMGIYVNVAVSHGVEPLVVCIQGDDQPDPDGREAAYSKWAVQVLIDNERVTLFSRA